MKKIITSLIIFLALSCIFLAYTQTKQQSPESQNWWVVYFTDPKGDSLNFVIENNSNEKKFHWEILNENNKLKEGNTDIEKRNKKDILIPKSDFGNFGNIKFSIVVSTNNEDKKEIYKIIGK